MEFLIGTGDRAGTVNGLATVTITGISVVGALALDMGVRGRLQSAKIQPIARADAALRLRC